MDAYQRRFYTLITTVKGWLGEQTGRKKLTIRFN
jgi:hypothetical protein